MSVKMKQSGIEWIGEIPEHWDLVKGKYLFTNIKEIVGKDSYRFKRLALTLNGIIERDKESSDGLQPINFDTYQIVRENNLIFKLIDLQNISTSRVGLTWSDGIMSSAYIRLVPVKNISIKFYENFYLMMWYYNIFNNLGDAGVRSNLNATDLLNIQIPYPPIEEQRLIAVQLNQICGTLDNTKADIEKQIEILNEYKKSVITEVVTKGLDKNVELKDSGIDWIGKIPEHWDFSRIKYFCTIGSGTDPITESGDTPVYGSGSKSFKTCEEYKIGPTVLLGRKGTINIPQWVEGNYWNVDTAFDVKSKGNFSLRLFYYISICLDYDRYNMQTTVPSMAKGDYENMYIPIPPINEQQEIVAYLDSKCSEIDSIIETKKHQLELLEEYKKSIIYEYVTGKREVSALLDGVTASLDEVSAKPDFAVAPDNQSVSIE